MSKLSEIFDAFAHNESALANAQIKSYNIDIEAREISLCLFTQQVPLGQKVEQ